MILKWIKNKRLKRLLIQIDCEHVWQDGGICGKCLVHDCGHGWAQCPRPERCENNHLLWKVLKDQVDDPQQYIMEFDRQDVIKKWEFIPYIRSLQDG